MSTTDQAQVAADLDELVLQCKEWINKESHVTVGELYAVIRVVASLMLRINQRAAG